MSWKHQGPSGLGERGRLGKTGPVVTNRTLTFSAEMRAYWFTAHWHLCTLCNPPPAPHKAPGCRKNVFSLSLWISGLYQHIFLVMWTSWACNVLYIWKVIVVIFDFALILARETHPSLLPQGGQGQLQNSTRGVEGQGFSFWLKDTRDREMFTDTVRLFKRCSSCLNIAFLFQRQAHRTTNVTNQ